jgi:transposase InsO family protein
MKRQLVDKLAADGIPHPAALKAADLASSSYYYRPAAKRKPRALDADLVVAINEVRQGHNEVYGYRKITWALRAMEMKVNGKKVLRHLRALGLTQPRKLKGQRWTHPSLVKPGAPDTYWEADFTYVWTGQGNAYLCVVIDAWDRDILGNIFSERCRAVEAAQALEMAVLNRFGGKVPAGPSSDTAGGSRLAVPGVPFPRNRPPAERHPGIRWGKVPGGQALHRVILWQLQNGGDLPP